MPMLKPATQQRLRDLRAFRDPELWKCWPFQPVVRRTQEGNDQQLGILYDAVHTCGQYGYSATVFLTNLFLLPATEERFFALPKLVYDTADEIADAGWTVD
jgi:hypothetical protein